MVNRRKFFQMIGTGGLTAALLPSPLRTLLDDTKPPAKPGTNISEALKHPRTPDSMPGKFPGRVVRVDDARSVTDNAFQPEIIDTMVSSGLMQLTGAAAIADAWKMFVSPADVVGLKVNPIGGTQLSTSHAIVKAVIRQLEAAGVPRKNIVIWDRREFELHEAGFTTKNFPGVDVAGTEQKDEKGSFYDADGKLYGERMIDKDWYYEADVEEKYDAETMPYMINEGKRSYFSNIVTKRVTKIINIPILKNAGPSVTLCLKNLAYGSITNTGRLHKQLWSETCAEVCAFPPLRDKVVLNIVDGIRGCYDGGPGADPKFFHDFKTILVGTDPVAVDRVGYDIVLTKRFAEKVQKAESPKGRAFLGLAQDLKLGVADIEKINLKTVTLS
jgi:uncharacterized protein (DUF362 family)